MTYVDEKKAEFDAAYAYVQDRIKRGEYNFSSCATVRDEDGLVHLEDAIAALHYTRCNLGEAAKLLEIPRARLKRFVDRREHLLLFVDDVVQSRLDNVEQIQFEAAEKGDLPTGRFLLNTLGKNRGYTTRVENDTRHQFNEKDTTWTIEVKDPKDFGTDDAEHPDQS